MGYVVYQIESTRYAGRKGRYDDPIFETERAAKSHITRIVNAGQFKREDLAIAEVSHFHSKIEKQVVRKNLLSGKEFVEPINTPNYCSPASESYWSM